MSVAEAAEIWGKSPETVRNAIRSGAVGSKRTKPRGWYMVNAADVKALVVVKTRRTADAADGAAASGSLARAS
jgi:hypothetical protein